MIETKINSPETTNKQTFTCVNSSVQNRKFNCDVVHLHVIIITVLIYDPYR